MDRVPGEVTFDFHNLRSEGPVVERWQMLLRVQATVLFRVGDVVLLEDEYFNVVEFATAAAKWLSDPVTDFSFSTMDAEDRDVFFVRRSPQGWRVGSSWGAVGGVPASHGDIIRALRCYIAAVSKACRDQLALEIEALS